MMYMYTHIVYRAVTKYMWTQAYRYPRTTPAESRTHAHLIDVRRIGASLQHRAHTGRESEACTKKQERVLVVIRDVAVLRVLHEGCLHLVVAGMLNSRFALLREEGRQGVRGECLSMPNLSRAHPVCIATVVHACLLAGVHVHVCACVHMHVDVYIYESDQKLICTSIYLHLYLFRCRYRYLRTSISSGCSTCICNMVRMYM